MRKLSLSGECAVGAEPKFRGFETSCEVLDYYYNDCYYSSEIAKIEYNWEVAKKNMKEQ